MMNEAGGVEACGFDRNGSHSEGCYRCTCGWTSRDNPEIEVDGKYFPTTNSLGERISETDEGLINFWRWFKGSRVVDGHGRPLVVYHGTNEHFDTFRKPEINRMSMRAEAGFWFTTERKDAESYGSNLLQVYLRIVNPSKYTRRAIDDLFHSIPLRELMPKLTRGGRDGFTLEPIAPDRALEEPGMPRQWVAFTARQIKSATANSGRFCPESDSLTDADSAPKPRLQP